MADRVTKKITYELNGEKHLKYVYGKTERDALRKKQEFLIGIAEQSKKNEKSKNNPLLSEYIDLWFEQHMRTIRPNTIDSYIKPVEDCKEYFSDCRINDIKPKDIKEFIDKLIAQQFKRQTVNLRYIVLCKTYDFAMFNEVCSLNPARTFKLPKIESGKRETLTDEQIKKVIQSKDIYANLLLFTGCRRNEALALEWTDIDFNNRTISINKQVIWEKNSGTTIVNYTKTDTSSADILLFTPLEELLRPIAKEKGRIFESISEGAFANRWNHFRSQINDSTITPHQFRHAYLTLCHHAGIDVKTAQKLARHAKVSTTLDIYTHIDNSALENAREKLNSYFLNL